METIDIFSNHPQFRVQISFHSPSFHIIQVNGLRDKHILALQLIEPLFSWYWKVHIDNLSLSGGILCEN